MDNFKRAMGDASTYLSRAVQDAHIGDEATIMYNRARQYTEEKLGKAERTENDSHYEGLAHTTDHTKACTEKMVKDTEAVLEPNPAARLETFMFDNIPVDKLGVKNTRLTNLEYLGGDMIEAGNEFGPATPYGSALIRVGQAQQSLGEAERNYIRSGHDALIAPMQKFLDSEMKNIMRERKILENKRLDLDACKNRVRKARAMQLQPPSEAELRIAQGDYDKQVEITKLLMEGLGSIQTNHLRYLTDFVESQANYYSESHSVMQDLQREISSGHASRLRAVGRAKPERPGRVYGSWGGALVTLSAGEPERNERSFERSFERSLERSFERIGLCES
eukprot:maker-scaffold966_size75752-snap-gene-0.19 protein:Tk02198 transcript:maker-scaffold966_size75752-snap-gene-0.19-mRNA-1 annotation:"endophilin-b1 isoform x2"